MEPVGETEALDLKQRIMSTGEESGNLCVEVKSVEIRRNTSGEGDFLDRI